MATLEQLVYNVLVFLVIDNLMILKFVFNYCKQKSELFFVLSKSYVFIDVNVHAPNIAWFIQRTQLHILQYFVLAAFSLIEFGLVRCGCSPASFSVSTL